jgi:hypothetical protein
VGLGCALPLIVAPGLAKASGILRAAQDADADPVWDHIAAEAWRTWQEARGPMGARGEHVRRLASQIDLLAVHLQGGGLDRRVDDEVRRMVRERGREAAAFELIDRHGKGAVPLGPLPQGAAQRAADPARLATCLDHVSSRGIAASLRARRAALDRLGLQLEREMAASAGRFQPVAATLQKPGDDFLGYPEEAPPNLCEVLEFMILGSLVAGVVLGSMGVAPGAAAAGWINALSETLYFAFCRQDLE